MIGFRAPEYSLRLTGDREGAIGGVSSASNLVKRREHWFAGPF